MYLTRKDSSIVFIVIVIKGYTKMKNYKVLNKLPLIFGVILLLGLSNLFGQTKVAGKKLNFAYVVSEKGLRMREKPSTRAKSVDSIAYGTRVAIIDVVGEIVELGGRRGQWVNAKFGSVKGYLFDGFLTKLPPPALLNKQNLKTEQLAAAQDEALSRYYELAKSKGIDVIYEEESSTLIIPSDDLKEVYFLSRLMFGIPEELSFPASYQRFLATFETPQDVWTQQLQATRRDDEKVQQLTFTEEGVNGTFMITWIWDGAQSISIKSSRIPPSWSKNEPNDDKQAQ